MIKGTRTTVQVNPPELETHGDVKVQFKNNDPTATFTISGNMLERARTGFQAQCLD